MLNRCFQSSLGNLWHCYRCNGCNRHLSSRCHAGYDLHGSHHANYSKTEQYSEILEPNKLIYRNVAKSYFSITDSLSDFSSLTSKLAIRNFDFCSADSPCTVLSSWFHSDYNRLTTRPTTRLDSHLWKRCHSGETRHLFRLNDRL